MLAGQVLVQLMLSVHLRVSGLLVIYQMIVSFSLPEYLMPNSHKLQNTS